MEMYNKLFKELGIYIDRENNSTEQKEEFSLFKINFSEIKENLELERKNREKGSKKLCPQNIEEIVLKLNYDMRKEFYENLDNPIDVIDENEFLGKKRRYDSLPKYKKK